MRQNYCVTRLVSGEPIAGIHVYRYSVGMPKPMKQACLSVYQVEGPLELGVRGQVFWITESVCVVFLRHSF